MNLIGIASKYLKKEFEMKDLGKIKYCLSLQIEYKTNGVLIHQSLHIEKILKCFNMDNGMKDLDKTKYCLSLQIEYNENGEFIHQLSYTEKILKCFNMDKAYPLSTLIVVWSLNPKKDIFHLGMMK